MRQNKEIIKRAGAISELLKKTNSSDFSVVITKDEILILGILDRFSVETEDNFPRNLFDEE